MIMHKIRVLRIIEYTGDRDRVERTLETSIHGTKTLDRMSIRVATIGLTPELLESDKPINEEHA